MDNESPRHVRILFFADSHLGFDNGLRSRIQRRRRSDDFERNFHAVIRRGLENDIDLVVHGGDVFYRSRIPPELVSDTFRCLGELPKNGKPVYLAPGNHERSRIPYPLFALIPGIYIFNGFNSFVFEKYDLRLLLSGFPYSDHARSYIQTYCNRSMDDDYLCDFRILCIHQAVEGSMAGIQNYTFRSGDDVVPVDAFPANIDLVLSGHIHKAQVLRIQRQSSPVSMLPVIYPGSIERTSFAERDESKGFFLVDLKKECDGLKRIEWTFSELPARPMFVHTARSLPRSSDSLPEWVDSELGHYQDDAIIKIIFNQNIDCRHGFKPSAALLRNLLPQTMNISIQWVSSCGEERRIR
ncbi:metallophosphoesterase [bacterium]|nr:metallophosphoesterase [candidate division CSSED10-310 bacterium]